VIGVILTGRLNDGTAGLYQVKRCGGTAVVQDPEDAANPSMPLSSLEHVEVDHCVPLEQIPELLARLVAERAAAVPFDRARPASARKQGKERTAEYQLEQPALMTCPDCGGAVRRSELGTLTQFSCHIGHVYTAEVMAAAQFAALERSLEGTMRFLNERTELCRQIAEKFRAADDPARAALWEAAVREAMERTLVLRRMLESEWIHPDRVDPPDTAIE